MKQETGTVSDTVPCRVVAVVVAVAYTSVDDDDEVLEAELCMLGVLGPWPRSACLACCLQYVGRSRQVSCWNSHEFGIAPSPPCRSSGKSSIPFNFKRRPCLHQALSRAGPRFAASYTHLPYLGLGERCPCLWHALSLPPFARRFREGDTVVTFSPS